MIKATLADDETVELVSVDVTRDTEITVQNAPGGTVVKIGVATVTLQGEKWAYTNVTVKENFYDINDGSLIAEGGYITGVKENTDGVSLKNKFNNDVTVVDGNGDEITDALIGTGCAVRSIGEGNTVAASYVVIVKGDIDGDGKVTASDYTALKTHFKSAVPTLGEAQIKAADTCPDGRLTTPDYLMIRRHIAKNFDLFA